MRHRFVIAALALAGASLVGGQSASGAPIPSYTPTAIASPSPQAKGFFGTDLHVAGDLDRDGVNDVIAAQSSTTVNGLANVGRVWVLSGRTGAVIRTFDDPQPQTNGRFGSSAIGIGDVNGDGVPDLAIGANGHTVNGNAGQGRVYVFSGSDGHLLYTIDDPVAEGGARFGGLFATGLGDVNGDHVPDFLEPAPGQFLTPGGTTRLGAAYVFSGKDGSLLYRIDNPLGQAGQADYFAQGISDPGDVNGDGVDDFIIGSPGATIGGNKNQGQAYLFSGKTGALLRTFDDPHPQPGAFFGNMVGQPGAPGDLDGDGVPDLLITGAGQDAGNTASAGQAFLFSGKTGSLVQTFNSPLPQVHGFFGFYFSAGGDLNGDGTPDVLIGQTGTPNKPQSAVGGAWVLDGRTGNPLVSFTGSAEQGAGQSVVSIGDANADGAPDYFLGQPYLDVGANTNQGGVIAEYSKVPPAAPPLGAPGTSGPSTVSTPTAITGGTKAVKNTSATVLGSVKVGNQSTAWFFQYGTSRFYGSATGIGRISADGNVSAVVLRLRPATTYHFRLVAINSSGTSYGVDRTFRTTGSRFNGRLILKGSRLRVHRGKVFVRLLCASTKACIGKFSLGTRARIAKTHRTATILCTKGSTTGFRIAAHKTKTVTGAVPGSCLSLIRRARGHQITAKLTSKPRTPQAAVIRIVKLFLG